MKLGAHDYITKPFDQDEALRKIRQAVVNWQERLTLRQNIAEKTERLQENFAELVASLSREHRLLQQLAAKEGTGGKSLLSGLPPELQEPLTSVEEFRDALLRILRKS
jgi:FixJ family two-component response regulator